MTTDIPAWFGRTFPAPYPVDLLPNLRARLSGTAARLDEAVRGRLPETLSLGPPGKWSAEEHVWHLVEIEALWLARVEDFLAERHQLTPANLTHRKPAEAEPGAGPLADALREFRAARTRLLKRVDGLDPSRFTLALPHPRLRTPMRLADHLNFVAEHDDHHLAHILALLSAPRHSAGAADHAVWLATQFLTRVWGPTHDLDAIDELMTEDYQIWSGGTLILGRPAFKEWVRQFQTKFGNAHTEIVETIATAAGDRVVSRWFNTGLNHGMFGLPADGRPVSFTGMSIWRVEDGRLAECWVERAAFESYQRLTR